MKTFRMKFNWGTGILIVIIVFIGAVVAFFFYSRSLQNNLVEEDYYEKELVYQQKIDKMRNVDRLSGKVILEKAGDSLLARFPREFGKDPAAGTMLFYRPSDKSKDFTVRFTTSPSTTVAIGLKSRLRGKWIVKMEWEAGGVAYYQEETLIW
jgi:hypothetical protein